MARRATSFAETQGVPDARPSTARRRDRGGSLTPGRLDVSVVICTYTEARWERLAAAIASVRDQSRPALETIVAVDHCPPLAGRLRTAFPDVVVVASSGRPGLSGARNAGLARATGDVVAFLDDDATAARDWLERLAGGYEADDVAGVGGAVLPAWETGRPRWFPAEFDWVVGCSYTGLPRARAPVRNLIGANMSFRREVFELVGGFSEGLGRLGARPLGCEETELAIRLRQRRPESRLLYEPTAVVHHHVPGQRARWRYFGARCYAEGLSKAAVSRLVGAGDGLAAERHYVRRVLPRAVVCGLAPTGAPTAATVLLGLALTTSGYLRGRIALGSNRPAATTPGDGQGRSVTGAVPSASPTASPRSRSRASSDRSRSSSSSR
jgi:glucosyl-dolichyl phosphate glucuronosyltransferase